MLVTKASQPPALRRTPVSPHRSSMRQSFIVSTSPSGGSGGRCSGASVGNLVLQVKFWNWAFAFRSDLAILAVYLRTLPRVARRHHTLPTHLP